MKIAHLLPYTARFPLSKHNGRYEWALKLAKIQATDGHQVTIYSSSSSSGEGNIKWRSSEHNFANKHLNNIALIKTALQQNYDIYHSHFDFLHYFLADLTDKPMVATQHWFPDQKMGDAAKYNANQNVYAVPPTELMHREDKQLGIPGLGTIHHGIDLNLFKSAHAPTTGQALISMMTARI